MGRYEYTRYVIEHLGVWSSFHTIIHFVIQKKGSLSHSVCKYKAIILNCSFLVDCHASICSEFPLELPPVDVCVCVFVTYVHKTPTSRGQSHCSKIK